MLIEEIATYVSEQGIGTYDPEGTSGNIYLLVLPDTPDVVMSVFLRGGPNRDPSNEYATASVQIIVRHLSKMAGMEWAQVVMNALNGFNGKGFTPDGVHVVDCLSIQGEPSDIGTDDKGRHEWSLNFTVEYKREA